MASINKAHKIGDLIRGFAVDQVVQGDGIIPTFTDQQVIDSLNYAISDLFGKRPEAFSKNSVVITQPSEIDVLETHMNYKGTGGGGMGLQNFISSGAGVTASTYQHGKILLEIELLDEEELFGNIFYTGVMNGGGYLVDPCTVGQIVNGYFEVRKNETGSSTTDDYSIISTTRINDGKKHLIEIDGTSQNTITLSIDGTQEASVSNTSGIFDSSGIDDISIPFKTTPTDSVASPRNVIFTPYFNFNMYRFTILDNLNVPLLHFKFDEGTGNPTSHDDFGHGGSLTTGSEFTWKVADDVNILDWALNPLSQKAASILLGQQSKDAFYREASLSLDKIYNGSI